MKLEGFLDGLRDQMGSPAFCDMPFEDRLGLLVDGNTLCGRTAG
ncbi:MAG: hypothetical protein EOM37_15745 [Proteobacteria bacterium]|jgi:hypothetical protein|nr:hypothetical protein [Pseudomonadota bacterium]